MSVETYLDTANLGIHWDGVNQWVYVDWRGWCTTEEVEAGIEVALKALQEHHATRWISDSRNRRVVQTDAQAALVEDWVANAARLGLRRLAIILPTRSVTLTTVEELVEKYRKHVDTETFSTVQDAAAWLSADSVGRVPAAE